MKTEKRFPKYIGPSGFAHRRIDGKSGFIENLATLRLDYTIHGVALVDASLEFDIERYVETNENGKVSDIKYSTMLNAYYKFGREDDLSLWKSRDEFVRRVSSLDGFSLEKNNSQDITGIRLVQFTNPYKNLVANWRKLPSTVLADHFVACVGVVQKNLLDRLDDVLNGTVDYAVDVFNELNSSRKIDQDTLKEMKMYAIEGDMYPVRRPVA